MKWSGKALALFSARGIDPELAATHGVTEADGCIRYPHGRYRPYDGKTLSPRGPAKGWWTGPQESREVLICEGETDALAALTALQTAPAGFCDLAVLALPGCSFPAQRLVAGLRRHGVLSAYLALDADDAGARATENYARTLRTAGITPMPVHLPTGMDVAECMASRNGTGGEYLVSLLFDAEEAVEQEAKGRSFADVAPEPVRWLWRNRIPCSHLSTLAGDPGRGKSLWTVALAAEVSRAGQTVLMANEDDGPSRVRERLEAANADLSQVRPLDRLVVPDDADHLRDRIVATNAALLTLDPWDSYVGDVNPVRRHEVYAALTPLRDIAKETGVAILVVCHALRPDERADPIHRIPVGLRDISRSVLTMERDKDTTFLKHAKSSYGPEQKAIPYRFDGGCLVDESLDAERVGSPFD